MQGVQFDWTINVGQVLTFMGFIISGIFFTLRILFQVNALGTRLADLEQEGKKQTDILITLAETETRMDAMEKRADERMLTLNQRIANLER